MTFMQYVNHPRYGNTPIESDQTISEEDILRAHWRYSSEKFFAETAIYADVSKQNFCIYPRTIYVDIESTCETCGRLYLFFAEEQKYIFEELGFHIDSHFINCIECRIKQRKKINFQRRYNQLVLMKSRTPEEHAELKRVAKALHELGYIKDDRLLSPKA